MAAKNDGWVVVISGNVNVGDKNYPTGSTIRMSALGQSLDWLVDNGHVRLATDDEAKAALAEDTRANATTSTKQ